MNWLIVLPFELTTAGITIAFWTDPNNTGTPSINVGVWITIFLLSVVVVNIFGVRGYGEVEFVLGLIKVTAIIGFILLGVIIDCGGVSHRQQRLHWRPLLARARCVPQRFQGFLLRVRHCLLCLRWN